MNKPAMKRQSGAALLIMMLLLLVALTAVLVSRLDATALRVEQQSSTQDTLAMAREALLDYAAIRPDLVPSRSFVLPCPDIDDSGGLAEGVMYAILLANAVSPHIDKLIQPRVFGTGRGVK